MFKKILFISYFVLILGLFLYSFTQVDLNLTLSRVSLYQTVEKSLQHIGYFNRSLSGALFIILLFLLYCGYSGFLVLIAKRKITSKQIWIMIFVTTVILTFSYNAFSYDIFNYIFDAKIFTFYHQNPYLHKALDFPSDPMVHFMRWTQRTYPYGPVWLLITVPLSFIGLQIFLPTFFLFKMLAATSFLGTCLFIQKISRKLFPKQELFNLVFFALNPLILIESLVSGHIDIVMMFFCMLSVWFLINKKWIWSVLFLLISIGIKFATIFLLPIFIYTIIRNKKKFSWEVLFVLSSLLMTIAVIAQSYTSGNFQPWYLLNIIPFVSIIARKYYSIIATFCMTLAALLEYAPFIFRGDWNPPVPTILNILTISGIALSVIITLLYKYKTKNC